MFGSKFSGNLAVEYAGYELSYECRLAMKEIEFIGVLSLLHSVYLDVNIIPCVQFCGLIAISLTSAVSLFNIFRYPGNIKMMDN